MLLLREAVERNAATASEVLEIVTMAKGFFKTLGYIGAGIKWVGGIGAGIGGAWAAWQSWGHPGVK